MKKLIKSIHILIALIIFQCSLFAQEATTEVQTGLWEQIHIVDKFLIIIAIGLLIPIFYLSRIFNWSLKHYLIQRLEKTNLKSIIWIGILTLPIIASAQQTANTSIFNDFNFLRWFLLCVILMEMFVLSFFGYMLYQQFSSIENTSKEESTAKESRFIQWWNKLNNFGSREDEQRIDTGHNYDGIRELDNKIPAWFTAAFVISFLFAIIYLWQYHIAKVAPLSLEEYQIEVDEAEIAHQQYLKTVGSGIDENALVLSTEKTDLDEGKKLYLANCSSCHLADGGGQAGPNLTDNNWINGCTPKDIYQSIKYGRKNGMMAWKDNFNDNQIVQIASFVKSLNGTKPATPKPAQGGVCDVKAAVAAPIDSNNTATK